MTGRRSSRKGYRIEKMCVDWFNAIGKEHDLPVRAKRGDGTIGEDAYVTVGLGEFRVECKGRRGGAGFRTLLQWIVGSDALFLHADNQPSLIALKPNTLRDMLAEAYRAGQVIGNRQILLAQHLQLAELTSKAEEVGGQPIIQGKGEVRR